MALMLKVNPPLNVSHQIKNLLNNWTNPLIPIVSAISDNTNIHDSSNKDLHTKICLQLYAAMVIL
jgi:hypothetical protein